MNPGELDRRIVLDVATRAQQANNEIFETWAVHGKRWAKIEFVGESEVLDGERLHIESNAKITIRYERINESDYRVRYNNKVYNISAINPIEGRESYIELECNSTSITNFKT